MQEDLIAPCGINCAVCKFYLGKKKGIYRTEASGCIGCLPRNRGCLYQGGCEPLNSRSVRFCSECSQFPCDKFRKLEKRYSTKYRTSLKQNLQDISEKGMESFLAAEESKWKCPRCDGTISIHTRACFDCGYVRSE